MKVNRALCPSAVPLLITQLKVVDLDGKLAHVHQDTGTEMFIAANCE